MNMINSKQIEIPEAANNNAYNWVSRLRDTVPDATNTILMEKWEVRNEYPWSLEDFIGDLESFVTAFQKYIDNPREDFSDQVDNQVIRNMWLFDNWKKNNLLSLENKELKKLIQKNEKLISRVWTKLIQKLWISWNGEWNAWELIADEVHKKNFG